MGDSRSEGNWVQREGISVNRRIDFIDVHEELFVSGKIDDSVRSTSTSVCKFSKGRDNDVNNKVDSVSLDMKVCAVRQNAKQKPFRVSKKVKRSLRKNKK